MKSLIRSSQKTKKKKKEKKNRFSRVEKRAIGVRRFLQGERTINRDEQARQRYEAPIPTLAHTRII